MPRATNEVDMSSMIGRSAPAGIPKAIGLVPISGMRVLKAVMAGEEFVNTIPTMPARVARSAK